MISPQHLAEYKENISTYDMAFSSRNNDQYVNTGQYSSEQMMGLSWDMPSTGTRATSGSSENNMIPFSPIRKPIPTGLAPTTPLSSNDFGSDSNYPSYNNTYGPSVFGVRSEREQFPRSGSPMLGPSATSSLSHSSSSGGLANMAIGYPSASSRPMNVNGNYSRSISMGQAPSVTSGFGSSYNTAISIAPNQQYSGQFQSQTPNSNSFTMNALKTTGFDDLSLRNSFLKQRQQETKRSTSTMGGMSGFGSGSAFMRGNGFNSANGSDGPIFDISDFPSLSSRSRLENSMSFANVLTQNPKSGYALNKQGNDANTEFQMHNEDFPALPGAESGLSLPAFEKDKSRGTSGESAGDRATPNSTSGLSNSFNQQLNYGQPSPAAMNSYFQPGPGLPHGMLPYRRMMESNDRPLQTGPVPHIRRPDDSTKEFLALGGAKPTYVPASIVQDHFGLFGFLQYMKCLSANSSLPLTSVGCDLHALGLVFNPLDATPKRFKGYPFLHSYINDSCTAHICHLDVDVPTEYLVSLVMPKEKAVPRIGKFSEDLLFYLFYGFPGDIMQFAAAMELYNRDWRFHKDEKLWITRIPNIAPVEKTTSFELGQYQYFDSLGWRKATKEMRVEYAKLDDKPVFPPNAHHLMPNFLQTLFS